VTPEPHKHPEDALHFQPEWCRVTLASIGDAVITTDTEGHVTFLNSVAESLTGWTLKEAAGQPLASVFRIIDEESRQPVESPTVRALREGVVVGLANHTLLMSIDGTEGPIDDSASPIRNDKGEVSGVVLVFRNITERRRHEQHMQDALAYAENIIATMREPFVVLDKSLRVQTANASFYRNFHVSKEETEGRFIYDLGNGQWDIPRLRTFLEEVLPQNLSFQDYNVEHDFPTIGSKIMLLNACRIHKRGNHSELILLAIEDITERSRQDQALHDALAYADNIIATLRHPFLVLDTNLRIVTANRSFYQNFHVTSAETQGQLVYDLGNRQWDIPRLRILLEEVLPQNNVFQDFEVEHDFPAIGRKVMLLNACRIRKPGIDSELILLAIEDITERRQAEVAVQASEVRFRRLFEAAKDGVLILDGNTLKIIDANPFMTELLGYSHDELLGKELWEIGLFRDKQASQAAYQEMQEKGYVRYDYLPLQTKDGQQAEVEFVCNVYAGMDHRRVAQCNVRDISARSRLERKTKDLLAKLSDLHRRKDEFLAMLGHELRNPLAPILNAVQLLRLQRGESGLQQQARAIIERQVGQLVHLVDDLLEVSRIATGTIRLQQKQLDMRAIVECGVETVRPLIEQRRHALDVRLAPAPIWIDGDSTRLEQVVVNLLNNAAKYTEEGGHIWLSLQQEGNEAVLQVRDSGVGIAPELMPRIFDLFTQAERSLARSQGGLGIGLALVQRLVEMHGGKVEAHSSLGQGSEFVVRLPVVLMSAHQPPPATETGQPTARPLRLLVVDDNVDTAESLAMLLRTAGHDARMAHDGPQALEAALDYRPNVVLLDIGLPGLDGFEVAKRIRKQPVLQNVVLVAMTGYGQETDRQRSQEAGFDHHLVKPARFEQVEKILASVSSKAT
jgi:PAS domain S-box-containing protein